jgi:hypothetical protein
MYLAEVGDAIFLAPSFAKPNDPHSNARVPVHFAEN